MNLDLLQRLQAYLSTKGYYADITIGLLEDGESISIMAMPGGAETIFYNGSRDKAFQIQINTKSKSQQVCVNALNAMFMDLETLQELPSLNDSYDFGNIVITSLPSLVEQTEQGYYIYALSISANILIHKGANL